MNVTGLLRKLGISCRPSREPLVAMCDAYRQRLRRMKLRPTAPSGRHAGVLFTPWQSTAVPLYSLECALLLWAAGEKVTLFFDTTDLIGNSVAGESLRALESVLKELPAEIRTHRISLSDAASDPTDADLADQLFRQNAISRMRGEQMAEQFLPDRPEARAGIAEHFARVRFALQKEKPDWLLLPGGIYGLSGIYLAVAKQLGIAFTTYDSGAGLLRLSHDCVAAHLDDIPCALKMLEQWLEADPAKRSQVIAGANHELQMRRQARDDLSYQVAAASGAPERKYQILIPLNVRWDSAALFRQRIFPTVEAWLDAVLSWAGAREGISVCIRQHPVERHAFGKSSDDYSGLLERHRAMGDRLRFVSAEEPASTYDLLDHAQVVLPHTSTVGVEAAMLGKPVVLSARTYYESLAIALAPNSEAEYFELISRALSRELLPTTAARETAALVYFLTQRGALLRTGFTPHPADFPKWVQVSRESLWVEPEVADVRTALIAREPLPFIRARRLLDHAH